MINLNPADQAVYDKAMAATQGPWHVCGARARMESQEWRVINRYDEENKKDENIACVGYDPKTGLGDTDAVYIASANPAYLINSLNEKASLRSQNAELVEALRPFARMGEIFAHPRYDVLAGIHQKATFTIAEFRAASSVLEKYHAKS